MLFVSCVVCTTLHFAVAQSPASPPPLTGKYGFNLQEKFNRDNPATCKPFVEEDFRLISQLGFNFVRLPMDYRTWIVSNDWRRFDENILKEVDDAVSWGRRHGVHVCINFHRAPGYTVNTPPETKSLWTDPEALEVCALHWQTFAKRYAGIPASQLSFNLLNEPGGIDGTTYSRVVTRLLSAIRSEDASRPVVVDGLSYGLDPVPELAGTKLTQSARGYLPMVLTHYRADWVAGSDLVPPPVWPLPLFGDTLYGPMKKELQSSIEFSGDLDGISAVTVRVWQVSIRADLDILADDKLVQRKHFECDTSTGDRKTIVTNAQWQVLQNIFDRDVGTVLQRPARRITISCSDGDWLSFLWLELTESSGRRHLFRPGTGRSVLQIPVTVRRMSDGLVFKCDRSQDKQWLWDNAVLPWKVIESRGVPVHVGEFGAYRHTPHDVALRWMEDNLANWKSAGWGWALWNFRGPFGPLDSERADVQYEDFHGHKLDRKMLELLQRYGRAGSKPEPSVQRPVLDRLRNVDRRYRR